MQSAADVYISGYGCVTAAGQGAKRLFNALVEGQDCSRPLAEGPWGTRSIYGRGCFVEDAPALANGAAARLESLWLQAFEEIKRTAPAVDFDDPKHRLGVIFASTKGAVEDFVWKNETPLHFDAFSSVTGNFLRRAHLTPRRRTIVSNACSSAAVAIQLGTSWLKRQQVDHVMIVAGDVIGPFVARGFAALKALATDQVTPFGAHRQGIQLGEAGAIIWLSRKIHDSTPDLARIAAVDSIVEGYAVTKSNESGEALQRVIGHVRGEKSPDVIIAHGTGTVANDATEAHVYSSLFPEMPPITATKWSIGHCLGASAAVDVIAGLEAMRHGKIFAIGNTKVLDPSLVGRFLVGENGLRESGLRESGAAKKNIAAGQPTNPLQNLLIASAGFGGVHAALRLEQCR